MRETGESNRPGGAALLVLTVAILLGVGLGAGPGAVTGSERPQAMVAGPGHKVFAAPACSIPVPRG